MLTTFRCFPLKGSTDARKRCINLMSPKCSVIVAENKGFSSKNYLGLFLADLGLFCHFLPGLALSRLVPSPLWSLGQREQAWVRGCYTMCTGALSIQPKIPVISVCTLNGTDHFGLVRPKYRTSFKGGPLLPVWSFRSVAPKCPLPFAKIVVPSTALFYPAYKTKQFPMESEVL